MPFSFSSRSIQQRPSVRAMQRGGYERVAAEQAHNPVRDYGALASDRPTHLAGGMSAQEFNAAMADRGADLSQRARDEADDEGGLSKVVQGIRSTPSSKRWDAFFGALHNAGADRLRTGAAAGYESPGFFDSPSISALQQQRANYLTTSDINRGRF